MIYKKYIFLLVFCLFIVHIVNVSSEHIVFSHFNNSDTLYDVTTIYKIKNSTLNIDNGGFKDKHFLHKYNGSYSIKIHSRTNALGLPIDKELNRKFPFHNILQVNTPTFYKYGSPQNTSRMQVLYDSVEWVKNCIDLSGDTCCRINNASDHGADKCYNVFEYKYDQKHRNTHDIQSQKIFSLKWTPEIDQSCISITYAYLLSSKIRITVNVFGANNTLITTTNLQKSNGTTTLKMTGMTLMKDQKYELSFQVNMDISYYNYNVGRNNGRGMGYCGFWFGILRIADCSNYEEEVRTVFLNSNKKHQRPESYSVIGNGTIYKKSASKFSCLNGGYKKSKNGTCVCPPGFTGTECEIGCGPNSYGADCKGICSTHTKKMCRGMFMCTNYGCTCPPGLTGPLCNKSCETGKYGADCKLTCTQCNNESCDPYTGACSHGCSPGYIQPNCSYKYPYLGHPPKLVANKYDKLVLKLNFQPSNVRGGNKSIKLKYYRIFYKALNKKTFMTSEIKPIIEKKYRPKEILNDLEPDTVYMVGVLLITDDGNLNDQDIVFGRFRTSCSDPKITDFNIQTIKAVQSINVKWNKITSNRLDCKITEKSLTLSYDKSQNKSSVTQKLKPSSRSVYTIKHLTPGYHYGVQLTFKTTQGNLISSPIYTVTPLIGNDIKVKEINTVYESGKIKISWKFGLIHDHFSTIEPDVDEPITNILRYKVEKILSCSLEELTNNWTSITIFNRTNYEIQNTVPNAQYHIEIYISANNTNTTRQGNTAFALTPATNPDVAPVFDEEYPISVTDNSVFFQWKFDPSNCTKLNGFFSKFYIELKNKSNNTVITKETKKNNIFIDYLKSNTSYELKVFIKTHIGYNPEHYLFTNFTTKIGTLKPIEDLMVYNISLENKTAGLRWSYSENKNLVGFTVSFDENASATESQKITVIPPTKCSTWPNYYCHTFNNLSASGMYTFKIMPKTSDYSDGINVSWISFNMSDALPDSPKNISIIDVGNTTVTIKWDSPNWLFNGTPAHFVVAVEEIAALDLNTCCVKISPVNIPFNKEVSSYSYTINELKPGSTYSVDVFSESESLQRSFPAVIQIKTL